MKKNFKLKYVLSSIITFVILATIYYFNNLFPFGSNPLIQVDADYQYIPVLFKIYDVLHGSGNIFYSGIGFGNSIYGALIIQGSLFSPLNLLLYFLRRDDIVNYYGLFIIIKISLMSLTSYIFINKKYPNVNYFYQILFSIIYAFNGFVVLNYFNHMWLDIVILFPLLVMYLDQLLNKGSSKGYIIVLTLCFIISFYFSFFVIIFILLYSFINLSFDNKDHKKQIFELGKCSIIAFLISAFSSIPLLYQIFISDRFNTDNYTSIFSSFNMKSLYVIFSPLVLILFIKLLMKYKHERKVSRQKTIYKYFILAILYIIPIFIDPINALLHGGGYWSFPYRYGFITTFLLIDASLYYLSNYTVDRSPKVSLKTVITITCIVWLGIIGVHLNNMYRANIISEGILLDISNDVYKNILLIISIIFVMYIIVFLIKNKYLKYVFLGITTVYSIIIVTSWTIYYASGYFLSTNAMEVKENINVKNDGRYKVEYPVYSPDFSYILKIDTLDNWIHILPKGVSLAYQKLGYNKSGTCIYSNGGTIFTDWLLNFKYIFSKEDKSNDDMFSLVSDDNYYKKLYKYNYNENPGIVVSNIDNDSIYEYNKFEYQNSLYKDLFDEDTKLIDYQIYHISDINNTFTYSLKKDSYLYFYTMLYDIVDHIEINDNYIYDFDDYIKYLGYYDSDVVINVYMKEHTSTDIYIGSINKEIITNLSSNVTYKNNTYSVNANKGEYLILPVNYINGIKVYNNKKEVKVEKYLDNFIAIKLQKGKNNIKIKYHLPFGLISIIISLIGIILFIIKDKIIPNKKILNITFWIYNVIVISVYIYYYLYSLIKYLF